MKISIKQQKELEVWKYFMPKNCSWADETEQDIKMFFEWSQEGKHREVVCIPAYKKEGRTYFHALVWGKKWAGIHIHEMWENEYLGIDGWMGYAELIAGRPREVVEFIAKEMFKGAHAGIIINLLPKNE